MHVSRILFVIALSVPVAGGQIAVRPGQYQFTIEMNLALPKEAQKAVLDAAGLDKPQKRLDCIAEEVKDAKGFVDFYAPEMAEQNCKLSDVKTAGNKMTFTMTCVEDDVRMTGTSELTFGTDSFSVVSNMKDPQGGVSTVKTSAKRVGPCPK